MDHDNDHASSQEPLNSTERLILSYISDIKGKLADPAIDQMTRRRHEADLADYKERLADNRINDALWKTLDKARSEGDPKQIARAEAVLADYLAKKLGRIQGKNYPTGLSLAAIIDQYNAHLGRPIPWRGKKYVVRIVFFAVLIVPLVVAGIYALRRKKTGQISIHN